MKAAAGIGLFAAGALAIAVLVLRGPRAFDEVDLTFWPLQGSSCRLLIHLRDEDATTSMRRLEQALLDALPVEPPTAYNTVLSVQLTHRRWRRDWHFGLPPWKEVFFKTGGSSPWRIVYHPPTGRGWQARGPFGALHSADLSREEAAGIFLREMAAEIERFRSMEVRPH